MRPRSRETVGEHRFVAFGVRLVLRTHGDGITLFGADQHPLELPPGWREDEEADAAPPLAYDLLAVAPLRSCRQYELRNGAEIVAAGNHLPQLLGAFTAHAEFLIAQQAPEHLFVHAGAVVWQGMGVVMPGHSLSGKTSLVRAFLEAGATYYSDEYAVLDRQGHVHPYPRPLAIRGGPGGATTRVPARTLGARVGRIAVPVGLILVTTHRPGVTWRPRCIARSRAAIALMAHAVAARGDPRHSMPILAATVRSAVAFAGPRGEATALVRQFTARFGAPHEPPTAQWLTLPAETGARSGASPRKEHEDELPAKDTARTY